MTDFNDIGLPKPLLRALREIDFSAATPVQAACLPAILDGRDVIAQARTGSGKTAAFALGMLARLDADRIALQGLVLCPTRELADQVAKDIRRLAMFIPNVKVLTLTGGTPIRPQLSSLGHEPHIVVGTPGRLLDLAHRDALRLGGVRMLVLDEADRMLDMGFLDAMRDVASRVSAKRQTLLFSATLPDDIRAISRDFQKDPLAVNVVADDAETIEQVFIEAEPARKPDIINRLLRHHRPASAVVFCNQKATVDDMALALRTKGHAALALHGDLDQRDREQVLVQFSNGSATVLVASDVAARGLDISELEMVINADIATDPETHVHRIGRTGRAGRVGRAVTLVDPRRKGRAQQVEEQLGAPLRWEDAPREEGAAPAGPPNVTLAIDGGKTDKLRAGDILGALTKDAGIPGQAVGSIDIFPTRSYVALAAAQADRAVKKLRDSRIKNRRFRIRKLHW
ncbi:MAG: ATP-dependent RNA helicase DbpA [Gammaproteobacteria bacterium]|nr:ATP-dependent RNA helicase DbpA [Gammaproteobacteria bacterium]